MSEVKLFKIGHGNGKLGQGTAIFDLPAGHTCPFAKECGDKVDRTTGKLIKNPDAVFRCFAATSELISTAAREKRWNNFDLIRKLRSDEAVADILINSINADKKALEAPLVRVHSSGDFFNEVYFRAWMIVAERFPNKTFYAYTKSIKYWVANLSLIPENFHITASKGGKNDELIDLYNLKRVEIVYSLEEAEEKGLEIDHDDRHCYDKTCHTFALLIHGTQPAGSDAMKAVMKLRENGIMGYKKGSKGKGRKVKE